MESNVITTPIPSKNLRKVVENYSVEFTYNQFTYNIIIPTEFLYDGASIPSLFWIFFGAPFSCINDTPSCVHDYLYSKESNNNVTCNGAHVTVDRKTSDRVLYDLLLRNNLSKCKAFIMYTGVRLIGYFYYKKN